MKVSGAVVGAAGVAVAIATFLIMKHPEAKEMSSPAAATVRSGSSGNGEQTARLSAQIEDLQRNLNAMKSKLATEQGEHAAMGSTTADDSTSLDLPASLEQQRAADAERHREYMAGVAEAFSNEKLDPNWANGASARVGATFEGDEELRGVPHTVECRGKTCRVQIDDDGSGRLNSRLPYLALGLADVLPSVAAERVDQGNGHSAMVLYMTNQRPESGAAQKR